MSLKKIIKKMTQKKTDLEIRQNQEKIEIRSLSEKNVENVIVGYGSVFNHESRIIYEDGKYFIEVIEPGAFDEALQREELNVLALIDHDKSRMLGRTKSGTLRLSVDDYGLKYEIDIPNTTLGRDIKEMINRGDYAESSFGFYVSKEHIRWSKSESGIPIRYISKIDFVSDISIVRNGAYSDSHVAIRELQDLENEPEENSRAIRDLEKMKLQIELLEITNEN